MTTTNTDTTRHAGREAWVDWMRVAACLMVFVVHSTEPFYLGGEGALVLTPSDAVWAAVFDTAVRSCVPLFIIASSYLLFPLRYTAAEFVRRRAARLLAPFLIWTAVYALVWGDPATNFRDLLFNFNYASGHLWFVYMLVGIYAIMPMLSPWAERVGRRELEAYMAICLLTTTFPLLRDWLAGGEVHVIYGTSGLPRQAVFPLWGECSWNAYGVFYYLSGFMGYALLGLYVRRFLGVWSWRRTLAVALPLYAAGFAVTFGGFLRRVLATAGGVFPVGGAVDKAVWWETTWTNDTIGVALMAVAWILLLRKCSSTGRVYHSLLVPVANASYGMYLAHLLVLVPVSSALRAWLGTGADGTLGLWTTPVEITLAAITAFVIVAVAAVALRRIPRLGRYIIG